MSRRLWFYAQVTHGLCVWSLFLYFISSYFNDSKTTLELKRHCFMFFHQFLRIFFNFIVLIFDILFSSVTQLVLSRQCWIKFEKILNLNITKPWIMTGMQTEIFFAITLKFLQKKWQFRSKIYTSFRALKSCLLSRHINGLEARS